jgi:hypothetical protein
MRDFPSSGCDDSSPIEGELASPDWAHPIRCRTPPPAESATLVRFTVYCVPDSGPAGRATGRRGMDLAAGRLLIEREVTRTARLTSTGSNSSASSTGTQP